jgi:hypothetical protein
MHDLKIQFCLFFAAAVLVLAPGSASAQGFDPSYFVPSASHASGAEGSFWVTDLEVNNGGSTIATYQLAWLPRKQDNSSPTMSEEFILSPGESVRIEDVVLTIFDTTGNGALAVVSDGDNLLI